MNLPLLHKVSRLQSAGGFTLFEMMIAVVAGTLVLAIIMMLYLFGLRSFAAMDNFTQMSGKSRLSLDLMSRDIRQAVNVLSYNTNLPVKSLSLATYDGNSPCTATFYWDSTSGLLTSVRTVNGGTTTRTLLTGCDQWNFAFYQRTPTNAYAFYTTTDRRLCKLIEMSWKCSRTILGKKMNSEEVMTAQVVLRNMDVIISN